MPIRLIQPGKKCPGCSKLFKDGPIKGGPTPTTFSYANSSVPELSYADANEELKKFVGMAEFFPETSLVPEAGSLSCTIEVLAKGRSALNRHNLNLWCQEGRDSILIFSVAHPAAPPGFWHLRCLIDAIDKEIPPGIPSEHGVEAVLMASYPELMVFCYQAPVVAAERRVRQLPAVPSRKAVAISESPLIKTENCPFCLQSVITYGTDAHHLDLQGVREQNTFCYSTRGIANAAPVEQSEQISKMLQLHMSTVSISLDPVKAGLIAKFLLAGTPLTEADIWNLIQKGFSNIMFLYPQSNGTAPVFFHLSCLDKILSIKRPEHPDADAGQRYSYSLRMVTDNLIDLEDRWIVCFQTPDQSAKTIGSGLGIIDFHREARRQALAGTQFSPHSSPPSSPFQTAVSVSGLEHPLPAKFCYKNDLSIKTEAAALAEASQVYATEVMRYTQRAVTFTADPTDPSCTFIRFSAKERLFLQRLQSWEHLFEYVLVINAGNFTSWKTEQFVTQNKVDPKVNTTK